MLVFFMLIVAIGQFNFEFVCCRIEHTVRGARPRSSKKLINLPAFEKLVNHTLSNYQLFQEDNSNPLKNFIEGAVPSDFFESDAETPEHLAKASCNFCEIGVGLAMWHARSGGNIQAFKELFFFVCNLVRKYVDSHICEKLVMNNIGIIEYIVINNKDLTSTQACAIALQPFNCFADELPSWEVNIPPKRKSTAMKENSDKEQFKVLHITDVHVDPLYKENSIGPCGKPLCCQMDDPLVPVNGAGYWGDYRKCDMPWHSFENLLDNVLHQHLNNPDCNFKYIYYTGDIINHRIWETSTKDNTREISKFYDMLKDKFGSIQLYPVVGNHETHPVNVFPPNGIPDYPNQWLFELLAQKWSHWLPPSAIKTVLKGGYYSVLVKPGFKIISINSNVCSTFNWWTLYHNEDQYDQLKWLIDELLIAEEKYEIVHLLSHYPAGEDDCLVTWAVQFRRIIERFSHIIVAGFNGHTHYDELKLFYSTSNLSQPIHVAYNGGSVTTFEHVNPNYKIYDIDPESYQVRDYSSWIYQIPIANFFRNETPLWYKLYTFKENYGLHDLTLNDLDEWVNGLANDEWRMQLYYRQKVADSELGIARGCDLHCMRDTLCVIVTTVFNDLRKCQDLLKNSVAKKYYKP